MSNGHAYDDFRTDVACTGECAYDYVKRVLVRRYGEITESTIDAFLAIFGNELDAIANNRLGVAMHSWITHRRRYDRFSEALASWAAHRRRPERNQPGETRFAKRLSTSDHGQAMHA